jgi:hypothetical protein
MGWPVSKAAAPSEPAVPAFRATGFGKPEGVQGQDGEVAGPLPVPSGGGAGSGCG